MNFYFCACAACTWKGNKPHRDGQCPVCGNSLDIQIRERRHSPDLTSKVVLSGLSGDQKVRAPLPDFSRLTRSTGLKPDSKVLGKSAEFLSVRVRDSLSRVRLSNDSLKWLVTRLFAGD